MALGRELNFAIRIAGRVDKSLGAAVNSAQAQLNMIGRTTNRAMTAATIAVGLAGAKLVKDSIKTYSEYETAVNSAAAVFNVSKGSAEYEMIANAAREAGLTTVKSAKEGANALEYMGLAGWSVEKSAKALIPVVKLSAATGMDLATTSDLVTDTMAAMGIGIDGVGHYLDVLAKGNNSANYTSQMLLESLANVGGVFRSLNVGIEDGAAVLGILANQGTKGSEAGTQLNTVLTRMQKQSGEAAKGMAQIGVSMFDAAGNSRNIIDVFQDMYNATKSMTDEERNQVFTLIGGTRGYRALTKIMSGFTDAAKDGTPIIRYLAAAYRDADGALDNFYDIKTDTLAGAATRFKRLYEEMLLSIGEGLAPNLHKLINNLTDKIPHISDVIVNTIESASPHVMNFLDYIITHMDGIISGSVEFAKAFTLFKISTTGLKGILGMIDLINGLRAMSNLRGGAAVFQAVVTAFTGISTSAGTAGGALTSFIASAVGPIALTGAAAVALGQALTVISDVIRRKRLNYADGMLENTERVTEATSELIKYHDAIKEIENLRGIINNPTSGTEQIENAKARLQEIADMLKQDYNLTVNADTTQLENAAALVERINRTEAVSAANDVIKQAQDNLSKYQEQQASLPELLKQQEALQAQSDTYSYIASQAELINNAYKNSGDIAAYRKELAELYASAQEAGIQNIDWLGGLNENNISEFQRIINDTLNNGDNAINVQLENIKRTMSEYQEFAAQYSDSLQKTGLELTQALAIDAAEGNMFNVSADMKNLTEIGKTMQQAKINTDALAASYAAGMMGSTNFNEALGENGKNAQAMAQYYMDYKTAIGDTAESAVAGAALIANGYSSAEQAAQASTETMRRFFNDMLTYGNEQGLFDGLNTQGLTDKITDMAHALNLIPENKAVTINADGNFEVIQDVENQIASLRSVGNVNVSINSTGDITTLDEAGQLLDKINLQGAADLRFNAELNTIEVLNEAQQVIAAIDRQTGKITLLADTSQPDAYQPPEKNGTVKYSPDASKIWNWTPPQKTGTVVYRPLLGDGSSNFNKFSMENTFASGTPSAPGGLSLINDQRGISDPREVVEYGGARWWYKGRNVLTDIPKGARIYNAAQSKSLIDGSHRNGLNRVPFDGYIAELHQGERILTSAEADGYEGFSFGDMLDMLGEMIDSIRGGGNSVGNENQSFEGRPIIFAPNINASSGEDRETIRTAVKMSFRDFKEMMAEYERDQRRKRF